MENKLKHIYWFAHYNLECPSARYRGLFPLKHLKKEYGISYDFIYPEKSFRMLLYFVRIYVSILLFKRPGSVVVIQKVCTDRYYAKALKFLLRIKPNNTIFDIDDAEYLRQPVESLHYFLRNCSAIMVGSKVLEKYCSEFNKNVFVLSSPIIDHSEIKKNRNKIPVVGWVGNMGNGNTIASDFSHKLSLFNILFPALKEIALDFKLVIIGAILEEDKKEIQEYFRNYKNIELEIPLNLNWMNDEWVYKSINTFDIGVAPMVDHEFNRAKSAFKVKQYLSCGVPAVASNVGENQSFIKDGINGYLCENSEEFLSAITGIINSSEDEYLVLSKNAKNSRQEFSMRNYCEHFMSHIMSHILG